jgi:outer membrane protein assembly factor BamE (lipoprotein component of BamABCDE complex)
MKATRGNFLDDDRLKTVQQNVSTKDEIQKTLGSPTTVDPFDDNTWFYIGEKTSTKSFLDPKVTARKVIVMHFNKEGVLQTAQQVDEKSGRRIDLVEKTTPTPGRDVNAFQQFLGNVGKYNTTPGGLGGNSRDGSTSR